MRHVWWALMITGATGCGGLLIDDPCEDPSECALSNAVCDDIGDGVNRCEAVCTTDDDCGRQAACLFDPGKTVGLCYRKCDVASDCAEGAWECVELASDTTQAYCTF